ncbi:hypothetical protein BSL78_15357 [Apostichopus japonicus]|uniref:Uncharacterized protein n=1 Tax=Stichopus japonicus TaxID=307972 RepID=A0A2G8KIF9_STIJA|nr:hypothetical protein BSL78_15357 [Apostichopus japonicus]
MAENRTGATRWVVGEIFVIIVFAIGVLFTNQRPINEVFDNKLMLLVNQYTTTKINLQQRASSSVHRMLQGRDGHPHLTSYQDDIPLDCHVLHRSNSCNNLPNYFMYSSKRPQFQSTVINFMHVPKSGGTTMKECMNMVASNLVRDEPFLLHTEGRIQVTQDILNGDFRILNSTSLFMGDYSFGFCDLIHGIIGDKKCSTFVILREPYDRMVSNYYYCIELNQTLKVYQTVEHIPSRSGP